MADYGEPWEPIPLDDSYSQIYGTGFRPDMGAVIHDFADRICACVNFCRNLDTDYLSTHTLCEVTAAPMHFAEPNQA